MIITAHPSPNHSSREGATIEMIVMHATAGSLKSSLDWLTNVVARVSTHYLIDKAGNVYQLVADSEAAWHAGKSAWHALNSADIQKCSIGVELENLNTGKDPYPDAQIAAARDLCAQKITRYHIDRGMVVRHLDIAIPKGRKTDPANFPWAAFVASLYPDPPLAPHTWRFKGLPIYQRQDLTGTIAGYITSDAPQAIDVIYANRAGHLMDGSGFVDLTKMEPLP